MSFGTFALIRLLCSAALIFAPAAVFARGSLIAAHLRSQVASRAFLRHWAQAQPGTDVAARTMATLDVNHDGRVDAKEIESFALAQGLDATSARSEFSTLDVNGDGNLDSAEVLSAMSDDPGVRSLAAPAVMPIGPTPFGVGDHAAPVAVQVAPTSQQLELEAAVVTTNTQASPPSYTPSVVINSGNSFGASSMTQGREESAQAKRVIAESAGEDLVAQLSTEKKAGMEAEALERKVLELRSNSTALARSTRARAMEAGAKAAQTKAHELLITIKDLEDKAASAEAEAASMHAKSRAELQNAEELMEVAHATI